MKEESINHPPHYGGADDPYEAIKVIEAWKLGFHLGNVVKYISRAGKKGLLLDDLKKARWYLDREIKRRDGMPETVSGPSPQDHLEPLPSDRRRKPAPKP